MQSTVEAATSLATRSVAAHPAKALRAAIVSSVRSSTSERRSESALEIAGPRARPQHTHHPLREVTVSREFQPCAFGKDGQVLQRDHSSVLLILVCQSWRHVPHAPSDAACSSHFFCQPIGSKAGKASADASATPPPARSRSGVGFGRPPGLNVTNWGDRCGGSCSSFLDVCSSPGVACSNWHRQVRKVYTSVNMYLLQFTHV